MQAVLKKPEGGEVMRIFKAQNRLPMTPRLTLYPEIKVLKMKEITRDEDDSFESRYFSATLGGPAAASVNQIKRALREYYDTSCHHEHDCCGRWYTTVYTHTLKRIKSGEWTVRLHYYCNV
jgi:hypothetical protein